MENLFLLLGVLIIIATALSFFSRALKQPLILAYITAGILLGPAFHIITPTETLTTFAQIGVAFLLFIVGLNLNLKTFKEVGPVALTLGTAQVLLTTLLGFLLLRALGFAAIPSLYIGIALAFSSTIIIVKLLSDRNDLDTFAGKLTVGILIVQDLFALAALIILTGAHQQTLSAEFAVTLVKGILLFIAVYFASTFFLPALFKFVARSQEQLFITSIAWCFLVATGAYLLGFSIEIGAFLAGISLAVLPYHHEITNKVSSLRDFFLVIFFVNLGLQTIVPTLRTILWPAIILSLFVLIIKPVIIMILLGIFGYRKHTSFLAGSTLAQISEFSLILITLGLAKGHLSSTVASLIALISLITIPISSYFIIFGGTLYKKLEGALRIFERTTPFNETTPLPPHYDTILFGCNRLGMHILDYLQHAKRNYLIIDINPDVIKHLEKRKVPVVYGDASDHDLLHLINFRKVKLIVSTIPKLEDTKILLQYVRKKNDKTITIVTAQYPHEAVELYHEGASYVITPHLLSGELVVHTLQDVLEARKPLKPLRIKHLQHLTRFTQYT